MEEKDKNNKDTEKQIISGNITRRIKIDFFKFSIITAVFIIALSVFYYYIIFLPKQQQIKGITIQLQQNIKTTTSSSQQQEFVQQFPIQTLPNFVIKDPVDFLNLYNEFVEDMEKTDPALYQKLLNPQYSDQFKAGIFKLLLEKGFIKINITEWKQFFANPENFAYRLDFEGFLPLVYPDNEYWKREIETIFGYQNSYSVNSRSDFSSNFNERILKTIIIVLSTLIILMILLGGFYFYKIKKRLDKNITKDNF